MRNNAKKYMEVLYVTLLVRGSTLLLRPVNITTKSTETCIYACLALYISCLILPKCTSVHQQQNSLYPCINSIPASTIMHSLIRTKLQRGRCPPDADPRSRNCPVTITFTPLAACTVASACHHQTSTRRAKRPISERRSHIWPAPRPTSTETAGRRPREHADGDGEAHPAVLQAPTRDPGCRHAAPPRLGAWVGGP